jgi:GT2 family glycosyltransferase
VCTAAVDGPAEAYFDARVSWAGSCDPALFDMTSGPGAGALFPYSPGLFGTGANMAFRRDALLDVGGFDVALGAGTRTGGGEDVDAFVRVLQAGWALAYEPSALVWHHHRGTLEELHRQMYAYGTGLSAFLAKHLADPRTRMQVLRRIGAGLARARHIRAATDAELPPTAATRQAQLREAAGVLAGPALYLLARRAGRRVDVHVPRPS